MAFSDCSTIKSMKQFETSLSCPLQEITWSVTVTEVVQESLTPAAVAVTVKLIGAPTGSV